MKRLLSTILAAALSFGALGVMTSRADAGGSVPASRSRIAANIDSSIVIGTDGKPYATGMNDQGQLTGTGNRSTLAPMTGLPSGVRAVDASIGTSHTLILGSDGVAYGAGRNADGQLTGSGDRHKLTPLKGLPAGVKATAVVAAGNHSLVLGSNGFVYGTGSNAERQLTGLSVLDKTVLTPLTGLPSGIRAVGIAANLNDSLVLGTDGVAYGTGLNMYHQLTGDTATMTSLTALVGLPSGVKATEVAMGLGFSLVLGSDGLVYGAGANGVNQLTGTDATKSVLTPLTGLTGGNKAAAIAAGAYHSLVLGTDGSAYGAGQNDHGQLTGLDFGSKTTLSVIAGMATNVSVTQIAAGAMSSLMLASDNRVYGTGLNAHSQLTGAPVDDVMVPKMFTGQVIAPSVKPSVHGLAKVGRAISVSKGVWLPTPTSYTYQWRRNGAVLAGATKARYVPAAADFGKRLTVTVTTAGAGLANGSSTSAPKVVARGAALKWTIKKPTLKGNPIVGHKLGLMNATRLAFAPRATKLAYQWYRGANLIRHATKKTYLLVAADRGKKVSCRIIGSRPGYAVGTVATPKLRVR